jgi:hypothetical protein
MTRLGLVIGIVLAAGCATGGSDEGSTSTDELGKACDAKCTKCHPGDVCTALCTIPDHCVAQHGCTQFEMCIIGYQWNASACKCQPAQPSGEACGPSLTCHGSDHCCTGPGPVSIDPAQNNYYCAASTEMCPL